MGGSHTRNDSYMRGTSQLKRTLCMKIGGGGGGGEGINWKRICLS